jgi:F-type H+-transporting ATPase subunit b
MNATSWATLWVFICMLSFLGILVYLKVPAKILEALDNRSQKIRADLDNARALREEAQALLAEYQRKFSGAEDEAQAVIDQARREAEAMAEDAKARMEEYIARRTKAVEQRIAQAEATAISGVKGRSVDVAAAAAARIAAAKSEGEVGDRLVDEAIKGLKSRLN